MWLTYSVNKEDIWVARLPLPIRGTATGPFEDDFEAHPPGLPVSGWNIYSPVWAPVAVVPAPDSAAGRCLELRDADPYDYAKAVRVFPAATEVRVRFRVRPEVFNGGRLDVELVTRWGRRPVQLVLNQAGVGRRRKGLSEIDPLQPFPAGEWATLDVRADTKLRSFEVRIDDTLILAKGAFAEETSAPLERLCFRTGPDRDYDAHAADLLIDESKLGDRLDGDEKAPEAVFHIDDVRIVR
jgi:hypothetical protein